MEFIYALIVGGLIGFLTGYLLARRSKTDGILHIDRTNPEKDTYLFEIDRIEKLSEKKYVHLKVDNNATLSQD